MAAKTHPSTGAIALTSQEAAIAYVITEPCLGTCDTACVEVCPVDCIHGPIPLDEVRSTRDEGDSGKARLAKIQLYINPEDCINCGACEPECPVEAIFEEDETPDKWRKYIDINANKGGLGW